MRKRKILFVSQICYPCDTRYRVWFDLNNSLTRWKRPILKFVICEICKFPNEKLTFFLGKLCENKKFFLFHNFVTHGILDTEFGLIWTTPWPDEKDLFLKFIICKIRKFPYEKMTFFLGMLCQKLFLFHNLVTHGILDTEFGLIWTTPWPDEKDLFLKFIICKIRKFPYEKFTFFLGKLCENEKFLLFHNLVTHGIFETEYGLIWTTPWPDEKDLFLKFVISEIRKFPYEKLTFFLGKLCENEKFFLFHNFFTHVILDTEFGLIWTTPWPDEKDLFLKFIICKIRKFPYEKMTFFLGMLCQKLFLFHNLVTHGILDTEFGLIWTTPWPDEKDLFLKFIICKIRKFPYEKFTFFLGKLCENEKFLLFHNLVTHGIFETEYGLIWTTPWPDEKDLFLKFVICEIRKFPYEKLTFFLGKLCENEKFFLFHNFVTHVILDTEFGLIWTTPWPDEKDLFLKFIICKIRKFPYEKMTFFLGMLCQKLFLFHNLVTHGILDTEFGLIWTTPWPDEKDLFLKFIICKIRKFPYEKFTFFLGKLCENEKFLLFHNLVTHGIFETEYGLIWTTPWPDEKDLFLKFVISEIRKFPYEKLTFFLGKLCENEKFFLFHNFFTHVILDTEFGSIWTTPWPDEKDLF